MTTEITTPARDERTAHEAGRSPAEEGRRNAPATVVNGTRVTIAFPFSHLSVSEAGTEVRALANLVAELAEALVTHPGEDGAQSLRQRAHALRDELFGSSRP